ncbi:MAG: hypothetical protein Q4G24_11620, partial [Paracoccus sp. (in: a-proteobacteria)]|uniref:hypothetical protein n=1 Tax=Paracoccus sp. TaxID=267 RepID=UPI0026E0F0BD
MIWIKFQAGAISSVTIGMAVQSAGKRTRIPAKLFRRAIMVRLKTMRIIVNGLQRKLIELTMCLKIYRRLWQDRKVMFARPMQGGGLSKSFNGSIISVDLPPFVPSFITRVCGFY